MLKSMKPIPSAKRTEIAYSISVKRERLISMISKCPIYECMSIFNSFLTSLLCSTLLILMIFIFWTYYRKECIEQIASMFRPRRRLMTQTDGTKAMT